MIWNLTYEHERLIHLMWPALGFVMALALLDQRGREALRRFLSPAMQRRLAHRLSPVRQWTRLALILATFACGIWVLRQPRSTGKTDTVTTSQVSADIAIVLDVSKSMLAEDVAPNRLARAKAEISDLISRLHGHRVGLIAFAGRASVLAPLTPDYGFFRMVLDGVNTRSVTRGGTRIGDAIRMALATFGPEEGSKLILLITDGEDHESYPDDAAKAAHDAGVHIVAVGFGSEEGSEIVITDPETGARKVHADRDGNPIHSRLDGELLRTIALTTEGAYVPAGVAALDLDSIVREHIDPLVRATSSTPRVIAREQYSWFALGALLSLVGAAWAGSSLGRRR